MGRVGFRRSRDGRRPETIFKNVQVLKGIPVDEFMGTLGLFSAALSVCCGDCHTGAGTSNPNGIITPRDSAYTIRRQTNSSRPYGQNATGK